MKNQSYNEFWQRIHLTARRKGFPLRVMFELTYRCNFFCRHCYVPLSYRKKSKREELKTKDIFSILDQLKDIGCLYLGFTGGEPFVREDIMDILWYAKKLGFEIIIYSNGSMIDRKKADELAALRPNKVDITIPAMSKNAFERISGVSGSRDKVFKAFELLHKKGVGIGFKTCVLKDNESEISQIQSFAQSLGAKHRLNDMLSPCLDGSKEPYKYRGILREKPHATRHTLHATISSPEMFNEQPEACNACLPAGKVKPEANNNFESLFQCGVGRSQAAITPLGELKMCLEIDYPKYKILNNNATRYTPQAQSSMPEACNACLPAGKVRREAYSLKEAWKKLKELVASIKPDKYYQCDKCDLEPYCHWCPAKAWLEYRNFTACDPESRNQAAYRVNPASSAKVGAYVKRYSTSHNQWR